MKYAHPHTYMCKHSTDTQEGVEGNLKYSWGLTDENTQCCRGGWNRNKCLRQTEWRFDRWTYIRQKCPIILGMLVLKGLASDTTSQGVPVCSCHVRDVASCPTFSKPVKDAPIDEDKAKLHTRKNPYDELRKRQSCNRSLGFANIATVASCLEFV